MSREIDARVHVEVMGGRFVQRYSTMGIREVEACRAGDYPIVIQDGKDVPHSAWDGAWHIGQLPAYSTDPAAAMQVKAHMRTLGWGWQVYDRKEGGFTVYCRRWAATSSNVSVDADTECEGVCLAALLALGVDAGEGKNQEPQP